MGHRDAARYRSRIHCGNVSLVWGDHDHPSVGRLFTAAFEQRMVTVQGQAIWLCHYPARAWDRRFHGSWHLYGHVHGRLAREDQANPAMLTRNVGVDACGFRPWSFEELRLHDAAPRRLRGPQGGRRRRLTLAVSRARPILLGGGYP